MKIMAIDPGGTTGFTVGKIKDDDGILYFASNQEKFTHMQLFRQIEAEMPDWIVCESFEFRNKIRAGTELMSAELIGVVHTYTGFYKNGLSFQTASTGGAGGNSGAFSNTILKMKGIYLPNKPHAMDSLRHLLYWYEFGKGFQFNKKKGYTEAMIHYL